MRKGLQGFRGVKMPPKAAFTENSVKKVVAAALKAGLDIGSVSVAPDGTITISKRKQQDEPVDNNPLPKIRL